MTKYYSDVTKKFYESEAECEKAELAEQNKSSERKEDAKEVEALYKEAAAANKKYHEALTKFCKKYGSFHTTLTGNDITDYFFNDFLFF